MNAESIREKIAAVLAKKTKEELWQRIKIATDSGVVDCDFFGNYRIDSFELLSGNLETNQEDFAFQGPNFWVETESLTAPAVPRQEMKEQPQYVGPADSNELALAA